MLMWLLLLCGCVAVVCIVKVCLQHPPGSGSSIANAPVAVCGCVVANVWVWLLLSRLRRDRYWVSDEEGSKAQHLPPYDLDQRVVKRVLLPELGSGQSRRKVVVD
jgi:hypothetical protein